MPTVYVTLLKSDENFKLEDRSRLSQVCEVIQYDGSKQISNEEKLEGCRMVDGVIVGRSGGGLTEEILTAAENLKVVGVVGGSVRKVLPDLLLDRGITLLNTGWAMTNAVAEFSLAMMLCGLRDIPHMIDSLRKNGWGKARNAFDLTDKPVGLVGFGMIGRRVAELLGPFNPDLRVFDPFVSSGEVETYGGKLVELSDLFQHSFVVSLHAGMTDDSQSLLGKSELALLPDHALLVNTARAGLVDESALLDELHSGRIRAALNVFWKEPLAKDHPLRKLENVILTPHGGGLTQDTIGRHSRGMADDMIRYFKGETPHSVVPKEMLDKMT